MYVIVRCWGRGKRYYHLIDRDGSKPLCGARLSDKYWTLARFPVAARPCGRCLKKGEHVDHH